MPADCPTKALRTESASEMNRATGQELMTFDNFIGIASARGLGVAAVKRLALNWQRNARWLPPEQHLDSSWVAVEQLFTSTVKQMIISGNQFASWAADCAQSNWKSNWKH